MGVGREGGRRQRNLNLLLENAFCVTVSSPSYPTIRLGRSNFFMIQKGNVSQNTQELTSVNTCVTQGESSQTPTICINLANAEQNYRDAEHDNFFCLVSLGGVRLSPLGTSATTGLLHQPRIRDEECGAVGGMIIVK
jgi:hypothetical protein